MRIVADENIPFAVELFSNFGDVVLRPGRALTREDVMHADILLVRSVTPVNKALLDETAVKFVGTCTIGVDHLDIEYLEAHTIGYASAAGCNANGVVQYVLAALSWLGKLDTSLQFGVVGCGNVGGRLCHAFKQLGCNYVAVDPHLKSDQLENKAPFDAIYKCDVICFHTPLIHTGKNPTHHLLGEPELKKLKPNALIINAGRGEVIDNQALKKRLQGGLSGQVDDTDHLAASVSSLSVVLDVWEGEPRIDTELLKLVTIGTPHIAGYSFEGRVNGSLMIFEALAAFLGQDKTWVASILQPLRDCIFGDHEKIQASNEKEAILKTHDIHADHQRLLDVAQALPQAFDGLRKNYPKRREFSHYDVNVLDDKTVHLLKRLGFNACDDRREGREDRECSAPDEAV